MRKRKPIEVICVDCGCTFTAYGRQALRCAECKKIVRSQKQEEFRAKQKEKKNHIVPKMNIGQVLTALEQYNKEHGTHISYGKYVQMIGG